jgi:murein tripeptide amidase MpaA
MLEGRRPSWIIDRRQEALMRRLILVCAGSAMAASAAWAQPDAAQEQPPALYAGHRLVEARIQTPQEMARMLEISGDCWACHPRPGVVPFRVAPERMDELRASGIEFEVVIEDLQGVVDGERARIRAARAASAGDRAADWFAEYKNLEEVEARLGALARSRPELVTGFVIGESLEGRPIRAILIGAPREPGDPCRPTLFLNGTQHAREWINTMTTMYHAERFVEGYGRDAEITALLSKIDVVVAPVVNPDGFLWSWQRDRLWRKNRRNNGDGTFGVDLNRNWGHMWGLTVPGSSGGSATTRSEVYWGAGPFSEPETSAVRDYVFATPQIRGSNDIHSYGELILHPWSHSPDPSPDDAVFQAVGDEMQAAVESAHGRRYEMGRSYSTIYPHSGTANDWFYSRGVFAYSYELRGPTFAPNPSQIRPCAEEAFAGTLVHARYLAERYGFVTDWDRDCRHTFFDFLEFAAAVAAGAPDADLNGDGVVDFLDVLEFQTIFGTER